MTEKDRIVAGLRIVSAIEQNDTDAMAQAITTAIVLTNPQYAALAPLANVAISAALKQACGVVERRGWFSWLGF